ncbi:MAG: hypothetical protein LBC84_01055 [Prevotellaceae bacterium]|jgi:glutamate racemase|nr:hypothetical protein [Prevotellaceae bacterium]
MNHRTLLLALLPLFGSGCVGNSPTAFAQTQPIPIITAALYDSTSLFFGDFGNYPKCNAAAPIGIFDSGTGGLTVMEAIVTLDLFNNVSGEEVPDGICDFAGESFIYLADQANMPYGNYSSENKTDFLRELVIKDILFLTGQKVKSIVIACNTATATGLNDVQLLLEKSKTGVTALGVINAGVKGALAQLSKDESATIGVMATVGTIKTEGYEKTIRAMAKELGYTGMLHIVNQPAMGFAEAVDEEPDFVDRTATRPRPHYRGPSLTHPDHPIDPKLLDIYHFDFSHNGIITEGPDDHLTQLQLNAAQNYARYHLLSLVEQLRNTPNPPPLKVLIMGCTHYPYHKETLHAMLQELRNYCLDGTYPYKNLISEEVSLVDPAIYTARELYLLLREQNLLTHSSLSIHSDFYITIPNKEIEGVELETPDRFTYAYKYGRTPGTSLEYVLTVPFSSSNIDKETMNRFCTSIPATFSLISNME